MTSLSHIRVIVPVTAAVTGTAAAQVPDRPEPRDLTLIAEISGNSEEAYLSDLHQALITPDGNVLVYDIGELTLLEFGLDGRFVRRIGREGGGPGEFRRIDDFGFLGDSLWVRDLRQRRITWFQDGKLVGTQSVGDSSLAESPFTFVDSHRLISFSWGVPDQSQVVAYVKAWDGTTLDSIAAIPRGDPRGVRVELFGQPNTAVNVFADAPLRVHSTSEGAALIVHRPRPKQHGEAPVTVIRYLRGLTDQRSYRFPTRPLADYESDRLERLVDAVYEQVGRRVGTSRSEISQTYWEALGRPELALPVYHAELEDDGRVWLANHVDEDGMTWVRLDDELRIAGSVTVPRWLTVYDINFGLILAGEKDELAVPHLRLYAIDGLAGGPGRDSGGMASDR